MAKVQDDALNALLGADMEIESEVFIKRLNVHFRIKAIDGQTINRLRDQATHYVGKGAKRKAQLNEEEFNGLLITAGCISPDFSNAKLIEKYGAKDAGDCVQKALLAGEIIALQEGILRLSGFEDNADEEIDEIKN
jgi:hypothetical protein